jgi:hypothetical protein
MYINTGIKNDNEFILENKFFLWIEWWRQNTKFLSEILKEKYRLWSVVMQGEYDRD